MIDVIIPYQDTMNSEVSLKYALRSLERLTGIGDVYVVGDRPSFVNAYLRVLECKNAFNDDRYRDCNIYFKCKLGMEHARTERVMIMHDDNFFMSYGAVEDWPWYYGDVPYLTGGLYKNVIDNTYQIGEPSVYSDIHCAHVIDKKSFEILSGLDWSKPPGYCIKTLCCVAEHVVYVQDLKLSAYFSYEEIKQMIASRPWFSTNDNAWNGGGLRQVMEELYPEKGRFEL